MDISSLIKSTRERVVAVEADEQANSCELFYRNADGTTSSEICSFRPWLLTSGFELASALQDSSEIVNLAGNGELKHMVFFDEIDAYEKARKELRNLSGLNEGSPMAPYRSIRDFAQQFMTMFPLRLFRNMAFPELKRLQLDIETRSEIPGSFPDARNAKDEVFLICLRESNGNEIALSAKELGGERELLKAMIKKIQELDPDVIEGHNIFNFDLNYLEIRCRRYRVPFALGRGGKLVKSRNSRFVAAERMIPYKRYSIYGRHVIDTMHLVMLHDVTQRDMESYGLEAAARYFSINSADRTYVPGDKIAELFDKEPAEVIKYCLDDVRECDGISKLLSPSYFYQAQLLPMTYQDCVSRGNATRIDALLCAEYLQQYWSLPKAEREQTYAGGLTDSLQSGVFNNVWHIDVRSLYPSIILAWGLNPKNDELAIFSKILGKLRDFRLQAKDALHNASGSEWEHFQALQSTFKILINSFYGYLGFSMGTFNDYNMAAKVTAEGREILSKMYKYLEDSGALIIEMDTDGIYFCPPEDVKEMSEMEARVQSILPEGIEVELDSSYKAMFAYKSKNYALLEEDGQIKITGAALKSRGLEPFQRNYMREHISLLLYGRENELEQLYERYKKAIEERSFPLKDLAKRETLARSPETYAQKLADGTGRRSAAYELVLASDKKYQQGDSVEFYVIGDKKNPPIVGNSKLLKDADKENRDENIPYYLESLRKLKGKFV